MGIARPQEGTQRYLVLGPTSEYLNNFLLGLGKQQCKALGIHVPLAKPSLYSTITNKQSATELFSGNAIRVPRTLSGFIESNLPMVAKPRCNLGTSGKIAYPRLLHSRQQLDEFLREESESEFFPQEFINGTSHYLLTYFARNGETFLSSQSNLAQQGQGKSILLARSDRFFQSETADRTVALLHNMDLPGSQ